MNECRVGIDFFMVHRVDDFAVFGGACFISVFNFIYNTGWLHFRIAPILCFKKTC